METNVLAVIKNKNRTPNNYMPKYIRIHPSKVKKENNQAHKEPLKSKYGKKNHGDQ